EDYVVIMTPGHQGDYEVLRQVLRTPARYVGCIGSRRKIAATRERLLADGFSEADFARVHAPIGLDIGGETPQEIALSVAAQLVACRAGKPTRREDRPCPPGDGSRAGSSRCARPWTCWSAWPGRGRPCPWGSSPAGWGCPRPRSTASSPPSGRERWWSSPRRTAGTGWASASLSTAAPSAGAGTCWRPPPGPWAGWRRRPGRRCPSRPWTTGTCWF